MKIFHFYASAGHGHQKVAEAIAEAFRYRVPGGEYEVILEDALRSTHGAFREAYPAVYYHSVKCIPRIWGWLYEILDRQWLYDVIHGVRTLANRIFGRPLLERIRREKPDVILSTHFFPAELLGTAKARGEIDALLITVITDFYPHTFWVNPGTDVYWVMSEETAEDLARRGVAREHIQIGGIPVDRRFKPTGRRSEIRKKWGFEEGRFTILLTSGGFGLGPQAAILDALRGFADRLQCFVVCGNNVALLRSLEKEHYPFPVSLFGFVDFMADLMEASDLLIAKPGGATTSESLVKELPMVVLHPIPGQETRNAKLLRARSAAFFMERPEQIQLILRTIMEHPHVLEEKRRNIRALSRPNAAEDLVSFALKELAVMKEP